MRGKSWVALLGLVVLSSAVVGGFWVYDSAASSDGSRGAIAANGRLEIREVRVSSAAGGRVVSLRVREGDRVAPGDTLALLDRRGPDAAVAAARAAVAAAEKGVLAAGRRAGALESQLELARIEARRYRRLYERDAAPRQAAEQAEAALERLENESRAATAAVALAREQEGVARAQLKGTEVQLEETAVVAPVEGTVSSILVREGEIAAPGWPVLELRRTGDAWLNVYLPLIQAEGVKPGTPARVYLDAFPDRPFDAAVERVASEAEFTPRDIHMPDERTTLVFEVGLRIDDPEGVLKDGFPADARILRNDGAPSPERNRR